MSSHAEAIRFGLWWPDGRPDHLRGRAAAWRRMAVALERAGEDVLRACHLIQASCSGEAVDAYLDHQRRVLTAMTDQADACTQLARSLEDMADAIDQVRDRILRMAAEIAASLAIGMGLSILTAGISAAVAEGVTMAMLAEAEIAAAGLAGQAIAIASRVVVVGAFGAAEAGATDLIVQVGRNALVNHNHDPLRDIQLPELWVSAGTGFALTGAFAGLTTAVPRTAPASRIVLDDAPASFTRAPEIVRDLDFWSRAHWLSETTGVADEYVDEVAWKVAGRGHAFSKHVREMAWVNSQPEMAEYVASVIRNPTEAAPMAGGRFAYWDVAHGTIVVIDPANPDLGSAFVPSSGHRYFVKHTIAVEAP